MIPPIPAGFDESQLPGFPTLIPGAVIAIAFMIVYCRMLYITRRERARKLDRAGWSPMLSGEAGE